MKHKRDLQSRVTIDTGDEVLYHDVCVCVCACVCVCVSALLTVVKVIFL